MTQFKIPLLISENEGEVSETSPGSPSIPSSSLSFFPSSEREEEKDVSPSTFPNTAALVSQGEGGGGGDDDRPTGETVMDREALRQYMREHSLKGVLPMPKERTPFIGENVAFPSPIDPETIFQVKRFGNREVMAYRDANAAVRYIMEDGEDGRLVTEKDYPMGTMRLDTVVLGLANWNITNGGVPVPLTRENILHYLDPNGGELDAIYEKILEVNPILLNNGIPRKNS